MIEYEDSEELAAEILRLVDKWLDEATQLGENKGDFMYAAKLYWSAAKTFCNHVEKHIEEAGGIITAHKVLVNTGKKNNENES